MGEPIDDNNLGDLKIYSRDEFKQNSLSNMNILLVFSEEMNNSYKPEIKGYFEKTGREYGLNINGNIRIYLAKSRP